MKLNWLLISLRFFVEAEIITDRKIKQELKKMDNKFHVVVLVVS